MKLKDNKKITFECTANLVEKNSKEIGLITASIENLNILKKEDIKNNSNFLYFNADLANAGIINRNGNGMTIQDAVKTYKLWDHTFLNLDHNRSDIKGFIIKTELTDRDTKKILTEEEALKSDKPINISVGFLIWSNIDDNLSRLLEEVGKAGSTAKGLISMSLELSYNEFYILESKDTEDRNMFNGRLITDDDELEAMHGDLKDFGGTGVNVSGSPLYLVVTGEDLRPLGAALTCTPAAFVSGVQSVQLNNHKEDCDCDKCLLSKEQKNSTELINKLKELDEKIDKSVKEFKNSLDILNKNNLKGSQLNNNVVKKVNMKITKCSDITDALLESKEIVASDVARFISDEIAKNSEIAAENLKAKENEAKEAQIVADAAKVKVDELNLSLEATNKRLEEIEQKASADKVENDFQLRMNSLASEYELTEEDSEVVASQVRGLSDEDYEKWNKSFSILAKEKNKEFIKIKKEKDKGKDKDKEKDKSMEASVVTDEIIEDPLDALKKKAETMVSTASFSEDVLAGYRDAFSLTKGVTVEI